jgi:hypothetical protein
MSNDDVAVVVNDNLKQQKNVSEIADAIVKVKKQRKTQKKKKKNKTNRKNPNHNNKHIVTTKKKTHKHTQHTNIGCLRWRFF